MASQVEEVREAKRPSKPGEKKIQCVVVTPEKTLFDELVDFSGPPPGPLTPNDAAWVEERLRQAGRRP